VAPVSKSGWYVWRDGASFFLFTSLPAWAVSCIFTITFLVSSRLFNIFSSFFATERLSAVRTCSLPSSVFFTCSRTLASASGCISWVVSFSSLLSPAFSFTAYQYPTVYRPL
jgi:hypothetical protein